MKTLIVEDDFTSRLLLQTLLAQYGESHVAVNGTEAVEAFRIAQQSGEPYRLVCLDIIMPEMDGQEALKRIREIEREGGVAPQDGARIIMTTGLDNSKSVLDSFRGSCDAYLIKPIDGRKLLAHLVSFGMAEMPAGVR